MRLALDTGTVRNLIHQHDPQIDVNLLAGRQQDISTSIAEPALVELVAAIHERRIEWEDWRAVVSSLDRILNPELPFLPGRLQLAQLVTGQLPADDLLHIQSGWRHICEARTIDELRGASSYTDSAGNQRQATADFQSAQTIRSEVHQQWIDIIRRMQGIFSGQDVSNDQIDQIVRRAFEPIPGRPLDCLDAAVCFLSRSVALSVNARNPYNPESNENDALDFELLYALALPVSVVCTTDGRLRRIVSETHSPQAGRVIGVNELNRRLADGSLSDLVRPESS